MKAITLLFILPLILQDVASTTSNPSNAAELQTAINSASAGDVIQLLPKDYIGDFTIAKSGVQGNPIIIAGTTDNDKSTTIKGSSVALSLSGDYWVIKSLIISSAKKGVIVEGNHNSIEANVFKDLGKSISIKGSDNALKSNTFTHSDSGITLVSGDRTNLLQNSVNINKPSLLIHAHTCCGIIDGNVFKGPVEIKGDKYVLSNNVASGVNVDGCNNDFKGNVFSQAYFSKSCSNSFNGSGNVFTSGIGDKPTKFIMEGSESDASCFTGSLFLFSCIATFIVAV